MSAAQTTAVSSESGRTYEILGELGRGGFGAVYKARHVGEAGFARLVAIKMLLEEGTGRPEYANRLRDEARLLARLRHRAIVAVDDLVCLEGRWAVVMEYVEGEDLLSLIRRGPIPPRASCEIALEVASGLRVIHGAKDPSTKRLLGIVHRDLKPSNIRITPHGEVKLLDFGIARAAFPGREAVTGSVRFESVGYVAPERMFGLDTAGSDIFSLGVVLYECLTGLRMGPLPERQGAFESMRDKALSNLRQVVPDPGPTRLVLSRMMAFEDRERPSAALTVDLLRALSQELDGPWLATWAPELLGRSRYGDPEDYQGPAMGAHGAGPGALGPSSTESLAVPAREEGGEEGDLSDDDGLGPPPTIGLSLPGPRAPIPQAMDALVPADEDLEPEPAPLEASGSAPAAEAPEAEDVLVAPVEVSTEEHPLFSRPPAPPPPPETLALPRPAPAPVLPPPSLSQGLPPAAGWLMATAAALLIIGLLGTLAIARWRPELLYGPGSAEAPVEAPTVSQEPTPPVEPLVEEPAPPTPPVEVPPVAEAPIVEEPPATPPAEVPSQPEAQTPAQSSTQTSAQSSIQTSAQTSAQSSTQGGKGTGAKAGGTRQRPTTRGETVTGKVAVRGHFDRAELVGASGTVPVGDVAPGAWKLRVRFAKELAWVETGLTLNVEANKTVTVDCSYESEACRIAR